MITPLQNQRRPPVIPARAEPGDERAGSRARDRASTGVPARSRTGDTGPRPPCKAATPCRLWPRVARRRRVRALGPRLALLPRAHALVDQGRGVGPLPPAGHRPAAGTAGTRPPPAPPALTVHVRVVSGAVGGPPSGVHVVECALAPNPPGKRHARHRPPGSQLCRDGGGTLSRSAEPESAQSPTLGWCPPRHPPGSSVDGPPPST